MTKAYLAIDQGTTSSRAILFSPEGAPLYAEQQEFEQYFPQLGWVEHDPEEIWSVTVASVRGVLDYADKMGIRVAGLGITNQRETVVVWNRKTGRVVYRAIVWQDRRTSEACRALAEGGYEDRIAEASGLVIDPYFSASKVAWILDHVEGARGEAQAGALAFGTIETFLIWRLTGGGVHASDASNAARTSLFNIERGAWDEGLCEIFNVPMAVLPEVVDCAGHLGDTTTEAIGRVLPILSAIGDQQAAAIGQACITPGTIKSTYGTGCFVILHTGVRLHSSNRLLSTVAYQIAGERAFALEGAIFIAGAVVQWLRDGLGIIDEAGQSEGLAASLDSNRGLYLVPAFTGLGAPWWTPEARGGLYGITRDTGIAEMVRAALESVAYQTADLFAAMAQDGVRPERLKVDGGMAANDWLMQFLADVLDMPVDRPQVLETTAQGAAMLAALADGHYASLGDTAAAWQAERNFTPSMPPSLRSRLRAGWSEAVTKTRLKID